MMARLFAITMMAVTLTACDRLAPEGSTKLVLQTPAASTTQKLSASTTSVSDPTSLADINCYGITISGPTEDMRRNSCGRRDGVGSRFAVGKWLMMVPAGSEISLDVPSGSGREIKLIGMKAAEGACMNLGSENARTANFSKPYIIGSAANLEMKAGTTMEVPISMKWDADTGFDNCVGPDFTTGVWDPNRPHEPDDGSGGGGTPGPVTPTRLEMFRSDFPEWRYKEYGCSWVSVRLSDSHGRGGVLSSAVSGQITLNGSPISLYSNSSDCFGEMNGQSSFNIPPNQEQIGFLVKIPSMSSHPDITLSINNVSSPVTLSVLGIPTLPNGPSSGPGTFRILGPQRVLPGICYRSEVYLSDLYGSPISGTGNVEMSAPSGVTFYTDTACTTPGSTYALSGFPFKAQFFFILAPGANTTFAASQAGLETGYRKMEAGTGSTTISFVDFQGSNMIPSNSCVEFAYVVAYNNERTALPIPANGYSIALSGVPPGNIYSTRNCSAGSEQNGAIAPPPGRSYSVYNAFFTTPGHYNITYTAPGLTPVTRQVAVQGIYALSLQTDFSGVKTPGECVEVQVMARNLDGSAAYPTSPYTVSMAPAPMFAERINGHCANPISSVSIDGGNPQKTFFIRVDNLTASQTGITQTASTSGLQPASVTFQVAARPVLLADWPTAEDVVMPLEYQLDLNHVISSFTGRPGYAFSLQSGPGTLTGSMFQAADGNPSTLRILDSTSATVDITTQPHVASTVFNFLTGSMPPNLTVARSTAARYYNSSGVLTNASPGQPRFDHNPDPASSFAPLGLLIEGAATNHVTHSTGFTAGWTHPGGQVTVRTDLPSVTLPDNTSTQVGLQNNPIDSANMPHSQSTQFAPVAGKAYTASVFVKKHDARFTAIKIHEDWNGITPTYGHAGVVMDLDTGNVIAMYDGWSSDQSISFGRQKLGNGWYRLWVSYIAKGTHSLNMYIYPSYHMGTTLSPNRDHAATGANYFWGAQLEDSPVMTSYIPTAGTFVSRVADTISGSLSSVGISPSGSSDSYRIEYALAPSRLPGSTPTSILVLCGADCNQQRAKISLTGQGTIQSSAVSGGVNQPSVTSPLPSPRGSVVSSVLGYSTTGTTVVLGHNGLGVRSSAAYSAHAFSGGTIQFGNSPDGNAPTTMHLRRFEHWTARMSLPAAKSMTTPPPPP